MSWVIKKELKDKKINVKGLGLLDFNIESADTIYKLSLRSEFRYLIKFIKNEESKPTTTKPKKYRAKLHDTK